MTEKNQDTLEFHYIKGPDFRTLHIDGAIGSWTPRGFLHVALWSERQAIPTKMTYAVIPDSGLGAELPALREGKPGFVRQMEVDLFLSLQAAQDLRDWLDDQLKAPPRVGEQIPGT